MPAAVNPPIKKETPPEQESLEALEEDPHVAKKWNRGHRRDEKDQMPVEGRDLKRRKNRPLPKEVIEKLNE